MVTRSVTQRGSCGIPISRAGSSQPVYDLLLLVVALVALVAFVLIFVVEVR